MWTVPDKCTLAGTSEEETSVGMNAFCRGSQDPNCCVCRLTELFVRVGREKAKKQNIVLTHIHLQRATTKPWLQRNILVPSFVTLFVLSRFFSLNPFLPVK